MNTTANRMAWSKFVTLAVCLFVGACGQGASRDPNLFGIYTADMKGENVKKVLSSSWQQMTHASVSPDHKWITFTRYNNRGRDGLATEEGTGYANTEIVICRIDGSDQQTVIPPKKGVANCNSSWGDDSDSLIWITTDNPARVPQIWKIDLKTRKKTRLATPKNLRTTDPHRVGDTIVFPVKRKGSYDSIYMMKMDGTGLKRISNPKFPAGTPKAKHTLGDYDPKLSPDKSMVVFMRLVGGEDWHVIVVNLKTMKEKDLTRPGLIDALPDWSSDSKLLIFWHVDRERHEKIGIYTMKPDGSNRRMVPLPRGFLHGHPHFWPSTGSGPDARIIYVARRFPGAP